MEPQKPNLNEELIINLCFNSSHVNSFLIARHRSVTSHVQPPFLLSLHSTSRDSIHFKSVSISPLLMHQLFPPQQSETTFCVMFILTFLTFHLRCFFVCFKSILIMTAAPGTETLQTLDVFSFLSECLWCQPTGGRAAEQTRPFCPISCRWACNYLNIIFRRRQEPGTGLITPTQPCVPAEGRWMAPRRLHSFI